MAIKAVISETCDLCRDDRILPEGGTRSIAFAFRGLTYDLDLCSEHHKAVTDFFAWLTEAGRDRKFATERRRRELGPETIDLRERIVDWVLGNGLPKVRPERKDVMAAYQQAEESLR